MEAANGGEPADFAEWRTNTEMVLRLTMGEEHELTRKFKTLRFRLGFFSSSTPQLAFDQARSSGVRADVHCLNAVIKEVQLTAGAEAAGAQASDHPSSISGETVFLVHGHDNARVDLADTSFPRTDRHQYQLVVETRGAVNEYPAFRRPSRHVRRIAR